MLQAPSSELQFGGSTSSAKQPANPKPVPYRRGHAHRRSAAISGDFDLDFFKNTPSINQKLSSSTPSSYNYPMHIKSLQNQYPSSTPSPPSNMSTPPTTPKNDVKSPVLNAPKLLINDVDQSFIQRSSSPQRPQQQQHQKLNSWAHSNLRHETKQALNSSYKMKNTYETPRSSNSSTPDMSHASVYQLYQIPEPSIDLDLAMGVYHDPASSSLSSSRRTFEGHRRTESAPELEDFLKHKVFTNVTSPVKNTGAIFEEEEDDEEEQQEEEHNHDNLSSTSSNSSQENSFKLGQVKTLLTKQSNSSNVSLNSSTSSSYQSFMSTPMHTPTSLKSNSQQQQQQHQHTQQRRSGASAARYQNYYTNSALLSHALKSSECLVMQNKPSISSLDNYTNNVPSSVSLKSSLSSSSSYSNSGFKFQSRAYDMPAKSYQQTYQTPPRQAYNSPTFSEPVPALHNSTSTLAKPKSTTQSPVAVTVATIIPTAKQPPLRTHKKSNSLISSLTSRIRGGSISSSSVKSQTLYANTSSDEELDADTTITPFNVGEPGPVLDLSSNVTPKIDRTGTMNVIQSPVKVPVAGRSVSVDEGHALEEKKGAKSKNKRFFNWIKK
ncbi:hypothetical protein WICPIJ_004424 [Wickerhamomyces pijperi]|uniref:Uncharacterized protein n=1 Tax=Wickerhamomyces pijperi TaxID=599730 RepID=A0A9P8Q5N2_WICPI|nr:hypothetical protein WICPIJ_004424 [Wickerhamomyces pijperi]